MDGTEHAPATDSPDLFAVSRTGDAFGPRLRRALLMLLAAIGAHVWLVQPRPGDGVTARLPAALSAAVSKSGLAMAPSVAARRAPTPSGRSVQVRAEFINAPVAFEWGGSPSRRTPEHPVATSGFVLASFDAGPDTSALETTSVSSDPVVPVVHPTQTLDTVVPRLVSIEAPDHAPNPGVLALSSAPPPEVNTVAPATSAADRTAELQKQEDIVRSVLLDYARAFERLDVKAAKAIWPSVDDRALQRAFQRLDGQQLRFASCGVSVTERDANARCRGEATYRPKVGPRVLRMTEREWTFSLARDNDRWQIVNATLQ
jgi:hypothetical protein